MSRGKEDGGTWLVESRKQFSLINKVDGNRDLRSGKIYGNPASKKIPIRRKRRRLKRGPRCNCLTVQNEPRNTLQVSSWGKMTSLLLRLERLMSTKSRCR